MTIFWQRWLTLWCIFVGLFGLILFGAGFAATTAPAAVIFGVFGNPLPIEPDRYLRFTTSLMGAVTAGWAATFFAAFRAAWMLDAARSAIIWRALTAAIIAWYAIDSAASIANGFALNAVSNTVLLVAYLVPVLATRALFALDRSDQTIDRASSTSITGTPSRIG